MEFDENDSSEPNHPATHVAKLIRLGRGVDGADNAKAMLAKIPNARHLVLAATFECLAAVKWFWEKQGDKERKVEPDYRTRLDAAKLLLAYMDGLPVVTSLNVNVGDKPGQGADFDLEAAVAKSPALRDRLAKIVGGKTALPA